MPPILIALALAPWPSALERRIAAREGRSAPVHRCPGSSVAVSHPRDAAAHRGRPRAAPLHHRRQPRTGSTTSATPRSCSSTWPPSRSPSGVSPGAAARNGVERWAVVASVAFLGDVWLTSLYEDRLLARLLPGPAARPGRLGVRHAGHPAARVPRSRSAPARSLAGSRSSNAELRRGQPGCATTSPPWSATTCDAADRPAGLPRAAPRRRSREPAGQADARAVLDADPPAHPAHRGPPRLGHAASTATSWSAPTCSSSTSSSGQGDGGQGVRRCRDAASGPAASRRPRAAASSVERYVDRRAVGDPRVLAGQQRAAPRSGRARRRRPRRAGRGAAAGRPRRAGSVEPRSASVRLELGEVDRGADRGRARARRRAAPASRRGARPPRRSPSAPGPARRRAAATGTSPRRLTRTSGLRQVAVALVAGGARRRPRRVAEPAQGVEDPLVGGVVDAAALAVGPGRGAVDGADHVDPQPRPRRGGVERVEVGVALARSASGACPPSSPSTARRTARRRSRPGPRPGHRSSGQRRRSRPRSPTARGPGRRRPRGRPARSDSPSAASKASARSSKWPGAFSVRFAEPLPTTRYDGSSPTAVASPPSRYAADAGALGVGQHRDLAAQPGRPRRGPRPAARRPGPRSRRTPAAARARRAPGRPGHGAHWSPRIARCGGRRPAMVLTMSTVCRVSTTWWTR